MFEAEPRPESVYSDDVGGATDLPERRQYTVKGIEAEAIELMRAAATKEGMKIGAWVSSRMKEAAFRSLGSSSVGRLDVPEGGGRRAPEWTSEAVNASAAESILGALQDFSVRLKEIEAELHQITKSQRAIMTRMLEHV